MGIPRDTKRSPAVGIGFEVIETLEIHAGRSVLVLRSMDEIPEYFTLWPGPPPLDLPLHPILAMVSLVGRLDNEPVWVESRPDGVSADRLRGTLDPDELHLVLLDICEALEALHAHGHVHGDIKASRVTIGLDGWVSLGGVGLRTGSADDDLAALVRLGKDLAGLSRVCIGESAPEIDPEWELPDILPLTITEYGERLARSIAGLDSAELRSGLAPRVRAALPLASESPRIVTVEEGSASRGQMDEVGVEIGPESEPTGWSGSQGSWEGSGDGTGEGTGEGFSGVTSEVTREASGEAFDSPDRTFVGRLVGTSSRMQVLARVLAPPSNRPDPCRFQRSLGQRSPGIARRLDWEPLDSLVASGDFLPRLAPIPAPGTVAHQRLDGPVPPARSPAPAAEPVRALTDRHPLVLLVAIVSGAILLLILAWWFFGR